MDGSGETESENNQQEFHLYLRLVTLLNDCGGATLRDIFRRRYENLVHKKWEDGSQTSKDFHKTIGKSVFESAKRIQKTMLQKGDLNEWDLALLSTVLQNIDYANGSAEVKDQHKNEGKAIKALIKVRNSIEHLSGKSICLNEFNILWKTASDNLARLDVSAEEIDYIRSCANLNGIEFKPTNKNLVNAENCLKAKELKDEGNAATRSNEFNKALQLYTKALHLYGVSKGERGIIYSNRSSVYLKLVEENVTSSEDEMEQNCKLAKEDAEKVIELRPTWCKGYYRLGRVLQFKKEWKAAIVSFDQALGLNIGDKEILNARDACRFKERSEEIKEHIQPYFVRSKLDTNDLFKKCTEERGMFGSDVKAKTLFEMNKFFIDSKDAKMQSLGYVFFAHRHLHGTDGYKINYEKAAELFSKAAKIGNAEALYNMGYLHQHGMGVAMDFELAVEYFQKAAKCPMKGFKGFNKIGVVAAQYALGKCYDDGVGKPKDFVEAAKWYSLASENGSGQASNNLAFLYRDGSRVQQSLEKAIQFWKLAASQGEILGMESVAWAYLNLGKLDEAEKWFSDSIKAGNLSTTLKEKQFRSLLEQLQQSKTKIKDLTNRLTASGQDTSDITTFQNFVEEMKSLVNSNNSSLPGLPLRGSTDARSAVSKYWNRENEIRLKAAQGFPYANTILLAMEYFVNGWRILHSLLEFPESISSKPKYSPSTALKNEMLRVFASCYRITDIVAVLTQEDRTKLKEITMETMSHFKDEVSEVDCDARVCYSILICNSLEEAVNFLEVSKIKYPNEVFFPDLQINLLGFLEKFPEALQKSIDTLERFPNNVDLLQSKAKLTYFTCGSKDTRNTKETMNAFKTFLDFAPRDHRKVPDAYYCLGLLSLRLQSEDVKEAENYLRTGNEAENNLLSCFIPYDSDHKKVLNLTLDTMGALYKKRVNTLSSETSSKDSNSPGKLQDQGNMHNNEVFKFNENYDGCLSQMQQTNPTRIYVVSEYRKKIKDISRIYGHSPGTGGCSITNPKNEHKLPSQLSGLKEIKLDEMNPATDHVYSSKVLHATIMEDSIFGYFPSIHTVIKDDNGDFILCYFYKFNQKDEVVRKQFSFGSTISILNPYHRLTGDLGHGIRIDDPYCVVFNSTGDNNPLCRFCCKPDPSEHCSKCKRAKYCGRNCQLQDWNMLKHRLVCKPVL